MEIKNGDLRPVARIAREQESFSRRATRSTARHAILPSFPFLKHLTMREGLVYAEAHFYRR
jgi:hypothetical protein